MATLVKLTRIDGKGDHTEVWVNLDMVRTMGRGNGGGAELFLSGDYILVTETPEQVAYLAHAENPAVAR